MLKDVLHKNKDGHVIKGSYCTSLTIDIETNNEKQGKNSSNCGIEKIVILYCVMHSVAAPFSS
jgi:hypothetical protein